MINLFKPFVVIEFMEARWLLQMEYSRAEFKEGALERIDDYINEVKEEGGEAKYSISGKESQVKKMYLDFVGSYSDVVTARNTLERVLGKADEGKTKLFLNN